ncbi:MAG: GH116 family glycosyl hydrolase [Bryobacteraceae bacterium]
MRFSRRTLFLGAAASSAHAALPAAAGPVGRRFTGDALREIAFPLGGIGTGTVSLGGYGNLRDWEIFNRPSKGCHLPFTFAALRLAAPGSAPVARVLEREILPPFPQSHGVGRERAAGLLRFREAVFTGAYPFANIAFIDPHWPAEVSLEAFNPLVPMDEERSSLPAAILTYTVRSKATTPLDATLAFSLTNPIGYDLNPRFATRRAKCFGANRNTAREEAGARGLLCTSAKYGPDTFRHGSLALATNASEISYRTQWQRGAFWDELPAWWREFTAQGRFPNNECPPSDDGFTEYATLAAHFRLAPGATEKITFVIAWHFPNIEDYWTGTKPYFFKQQIDEKRLIRNRYGTRFPDAWAPAAYTLRHLNELRADSVKYRDALYTSTLPPEVIDAISSQVSTIRTNTYLVTENGTPLAFEGCGDDEGCCPFNCTHVYNYEQALANLFPSLERRIREVDFLQNLRPDGYMSFRTATPVQPGAYTKIPAADGQMGTILKLYREWLLSGDDAFLRRLWPGAKKAMEFAFTHWDKDRDGVMEGEQHNTYDIRFYGPNSMIGTLYLAALAACARMAAHLGDPSAAEFDKLRQQGAAELDRLLWNGEYYIQKTDERDKRAATWQFGEGCLSDQLLGQWFAELTGLGKLLPPQRIRQCLDSIVRYNFRENFHDMPSGQRIYALNDEKGLLVCSWPQGKRPAVPFGYCDEVWTGVEYQVAAHLFMEGKAADGLRLVRAVRDRHDGRRRNPWDEVECGHHYARALSSWSLLNAISGIQVNLPEKRLTFHPKTVATEFRTLFTAGTGWGVYEQKGTAASLRIHGGTLELAALEVTPSKPITFQPPRTLRAGEELKITLTKEKKS